LALLLQGCPEGFPQEGSQTVPSADRTRNVYSRTISPLRLGELASKPLSSGATTRPPTLTAPYRLRASRRQYRLALLLRRVGRQAHRKRRHLHPQAAQMAAVGMGWTSNWFSDCEHARSSSHSYVYVHLPF